MARADIVEVIGQFLRLKRRGTNYLANCPFHNEKTPSFNVSPSKGIYKCFGCGKAGNVVSFLQEHEKLTYPEAIKWLADYYKIQIAETEASPERQQQQQVAESLRLLNEYAASYFSRYLTDSDEGKVVGMSYFKQRGFRQETIDKFRLGFNSDHNDDFYRNAIKKGYSIDLLEKAGLIKNRNGTYYDVYRGRVIFPIQSNSGRILGFGARILKTTEKAPKYINTPENEIYIKHKVLYGLYQSRQAIGKHDECYLVEGYTDVISLHQGGVENVVASSGTSLTEDQLRMIGQLTKNLTILYDGDAAGIKAALRGLDMALSQSFNVQLVLLPEGDDPDSYIQKMGAAKFREYVNANKTDIISFRMQVGMKEVGNDPIKKSKLVNEVAETISRINKVEEFSLQSHYIRIAAAKLDVDEAGLIALINKNIRERIETEQKQKKDGAQPGQLPSDVPPEFTDDDATATTSKFDDSQEWQLLRVLIEFGHLPYGPDDLKTTVAHHIHAIVDPELLEDEWVRKLYDEYFGHMARFGDTPETFYFINHPDEYVRTRMANLLHPRKEISNKWRERYGIESLTGNLVYVSDVDSSLAYFELKKLLEFQEHVWNLLKDEHDEAKQHALQVRYMELKATERDILKKHGTVVYQLLKRKMR